MLNQGRIDLLERVPLLKRTLKSRAFQPAAMLLTLAVFTLAILAGLVGTPAGSRNFGIVFVWIVWWRCHCGACPILRAAVVHYLSHPGAGRMASAPRSCSAGWASCGRVACASPGA